MWYKSCYRRNLVDMHIADWDESFLSEFDPEKYVANLKIAQIQAAMLYFQSHAGHCYFPTKVGHMHKAFEKRPDMMRRTVELCHREGIKVVGYYSLIFNTHEEDNHPEWAIINRTSGKSRRVDGSRYGLCCPNNPEYVEFVKAQIREMAEYFTVDGMFYDMLFFPHVCDCESCRARYKAESGNELPGGKVPGINWTDPVWRDFQRMRVGWMGEFAQTVTEYTKKLMPGVTVEHNCAGSISQPACTCNTELVMRECDYVGGDLYGDLYNHSFAAKYYYSATNNQPFEYMTCRCDKKLLAHTNSKSEEHLAVEILLTAAHHGATLIIDAIDPVGTLNRDAFELVGRVFDMQKPYEKYFSGELIADVGVYYSERGNFNTRGQDFDSKAASVSLSRALIEKNIPFAVVTNSQTADISKYRLVLAPHINEISDENRRDLKEYVENGGNLYFSGAEDAELLEMLLGAKFSGYTEETSVYLAPTENSKRYFDGFSEEYPLPIEASIPMIGISGAEVLATLTLPYTKPGEMRFASIHSNPPGIKTDIPVLIRKKVGSGTVIWSAAPIECDDRRAHRRVLHSLLDSMVGYDSYTVCSDAPRQVELISFRREEDILVSAIDLMCTDEMLAVPGFTVSIRCDCPTRIIRLASKDVPDADMEFRYTNGMVSFKVDGLVMFEMYRIVLS